MTQFKNTRRGAALKRPLIAALLTIGMIVPSVGLVQTAGAAESAPVAAQTSSVAAQPGAAKAQPGAAKKPAAQAKPASPVTAPKASEAQETATAQKTQRQAAAAAAAAETSAPVAPAAKPAAAAPAQSAPAKTTAPAAAADEPTVYYHFYTDPDSESSDQSIACTTGKTIAQCPGFPYLTISKPGYQFAGWYASKDFSGSPIDPNTTIVDKGWAAFYAKWLKVEKTFTLTFETNGGSVIAPQQVKSGESYAGDAVTTRDGYTFAGWFADKELAKPVDLTTLKLSADTTVYAKWTKNETKPQQPGDHNQTKPETKPSTKPASKPAAKKATAKKSTARKTTAKKSTKKLSKTGASIAPIAILALVLAGAGIVLGRKRAE